MKLFLNKTDQTKVSLPETQLKMYLTHGEFLSEKLNLWQTKNIRKVGSMHFKKILQKGNTI